VLIVLTAGNTLLSRAREITAVPVIGWRCPEQIGVCWRLL